MTKRLVTDPRRFTTFLECCFLLSLLLPINLFAQSDSVTITSAGTCCFDFTVKNRNSNRQMITQIIIVSPGNILSATSPANWIIVRQSNDSVVYVHGGGSNYLTAGNTVSGFGICFRSVGAINGWWGTFSGALISSGNFTVQCAVTPDSVSTAQLGSTCCYRFKVWNNNSAQRTIDIVRFVLPARSGATMLSSNKHFSWTWRTSKPDTIIFETQNSPGITPNGWMDEFDICFGITSPTFDIEWTTGFKTATSGVWQEISKGSLTLDCDATRDEVTPTGEYGCCFRWNIRNSNSSQLRINRYHLVIMTPGVSFGTIDSVTGGKTNFILTSQAPTSLVFVSRYPAIGIAPGWAEEGMRTCLVTPQAGVDSFQIAWRTFNNSMLLSSDTVWIRCLKTCDEVIPMRGGSRCYQWAMRNRNWQLKSIDDFHLSIQTPGVSFASIDSSALFIVTNVTATSVSFRSRNIGTTILPGSDWIMPIVTCLNIPMSGQDIISKIVWRTTHDGQTLCEDTTSVVSTGIQPPTDSITYNQQNCCYTVTLQNRNASKASISGFRIDILTPGWSVLQGFVPPQGWNASLVQQGIHFTTDTNPILPDSLANFQMCFTSTVSGASFQIRWQSLSANQTINDDTAWLQCVPQISCDSVSYFTLAGCMYDLTLKNRNPQHASITALEIELLTPGWYFNGWAPPNAWSVTPLSPTRLLYSADSTALSPGVDMSGFRFILHVFPYATAGQFRWKTTQANGIICEGITSYSCMPTDGCDSVGITQPTNCCASLGIKNKHNTALVTDIRLSILTLNPGLSFAQIEPNGSWTVKEHQAKSVRWSTNSQPLSPGEILSGFNFCLDRISGASDSAWIFWETLSNDSVLCSSLFKMSCWQAITGRDSIQTTKTAGACCYNIRVKNRHSPQSSIDGVAFSIQSPGATFLPTPGAPTSWDLTVFNVYQVIYNTRINSIPSGSSLDGFTFCLSAAPNISYPVVILWNTVASGKIVSQDSLKIDCRSIPDYCDTIEIVQGSSSNCCYDLLVRNRHTTNIDGVAMQIESPDISFNGVPIVPVGWFISGAGQTVFQSSGINAPILPGSSLSGFRFCLSKGQSPLSLVRIVWTTRFQGQQECTDTLQLTCLGSTSIENIPSGMPSTCHLHQNYPNPFNPATTIEFDLPYSGDAVLSVRDALGRVNIVLHNGRLEAGKYKYHLDVSNLESGIYYYNLRFGLTTRTRAMLLIK